MNSVLVTSACVEFRETLARHRKELQREEPERLSVPWFFLRYLRRVERCAHASPSARDVNAAMRGLTRFYVDSIANNAALTARFEDVLAAHRHALRAEQTATGA